MTPNPPIQSSPQLVSYDRSRVAAVVPAKNEEQGLYELLHEIQKFVGQLIVIDGHSIDRTREEALRAGAIVLSDTGKGKGAAIRSVIPHIHSEVVVFLDADYSHDPNDIPKLIVPILEGSADHVTGSRLLGGSSELHGGFDECFRLMGSSFITACINWRFQVRLSDSQNGFRAIRTDVLRQLDLRERITTIEQEMIMETLRKGFRMGEVGAHEYPRKFGTSHVHLLKVWPAYLLSLLRGLIRR